MANLLYTELRTDNYGNQEYNPITNEQTKIINNIVMLNELPEAFARVTVTPPDDSTMVEIDIRQPITNANQYKVNYNSPNATVYFHSDREGQTMTFAYTGMGLIYIDGSRVVTLYQNGTISETLNQLADAMRQATQDAINTQSEIQLNENVRQDNESTRESNETTRQANELEREQLKQEVETETLIIYKDTISSYSMINTAYPNPQIGWVTQTSDTKSRYRYNGTNWINIGIYLDSGDIIVSSNQPTDIVNMWIKNSSKYIPYIPQNNQYKALSTVSIINEDGTNEITPSVIGNINNLSTTDKSSIVNAINEHGTTISNKADKTYVDTQDTALYNKLGNLSNLTTDYKADLVGAVNEHETQINTNTSSLADITTNKLPLKANQSDLNTTNTNVATNTSAIALKADKTTIWDMAHMGQDVKTAITGGGVAVVGNLGVHANNLGADLLSTVGNFTQAVYTIITSTYWDGTKNLNQSATSSNYNSIQYTVSPNEVYAITTMIDTSTLAIARFYDVSGNYMSGSTIGYGQTGTYTDYKIVVPSGAVTMTITSKNTLLPVLKKHNLLDLNGFKDGFNYFDPVSATLQNGFYDNYNAGFVSNSNYKSIYIACVPGDVYNCDTVINTSSLAIVWFWNSSNVKLSSIGLGQQGTYTNYEFTIPNGAAYLSITSANPNLPVLRKKKLSTYASIHSEITNNQANINNLNKFFYKYSSAGNQLKVFIPYKDKYKLFQFEKGGVNQIFGMGFRYDLTDLDNESDKVQSYNLITDWVSPYIVNVASNADGDNKDDISVPNLDKWTGGWHSYNGTQTGTNSTIPSARCVSYEIFIDGKKITTDVSSKLPWLSEIKIVVVNRVESWQTRKLDGTGREVLQETVTYKVHPNGEILVENEIQALEQISIPTYFGLQVDTQSTFHKLFYDDDATKLWIEALNIHTQSGNKTNSNCKSFVCADDNGNYIKAFVDNTFGLYRHDYLDSTNPLAHSESYNKAYFNAVLASSSYMNLNTSEIAKWKGGWLFYCI